MIATMARITIAMTLVSSGLAHAGIDKAGTTAANFLSIGSGAGVLGMGGAVLGLGRDLNAASWNPGALGWMGETQLVLSHSGLADEQAQEWLATGGRLGNSGTRWALSGLYHGQGSFDGRDATGAATGSFNVSSTALGGQVAQNFGDRGTFGVGVKYVSEDLGATRGSGLTFDLGGMLQAGQFGFGFAAKNLSGSMKYDGASYPFPTNYGMGASMTIPEQGLRFAIDANFPEAYYSDVRGGVEWMWRDQFALRAGYRAELGADSGEPLSGPSFGMGTGIGGLWFDYGYLISGMGDGGEHRMGMTLVPGRFNGAFGQASHDEPAVNIAATRRAELKVTKAAEKAAAKLGAEKARAAKQEAERLESAKKDAAKLEAAKLESARGEAARREADAAAVAKTQASNLEADDAAKAAALKADALKADAAKAAAAKAAALKAAADKEAADRVTAEKAAAQKDVPPAKIPTSHRVADGETLYRIAKLYGTTVPKIMEANNMVNEDLRVGQVLKLPKPPQR